MFAGRIGAIVMSRKRHGERRRRPSEEEIDLLKTCDRMNHLFQSNQLDRVIEDLDIKENSTAKLRFHSVIIYQSCRCEFSTNSQYQKSLKIIKMTEEFWQEDKKKQESNPFNVNPIMQQTYKDARSIASDKHPKALYAECLKQSTYWTHYAASPRVSIDDMAMMLCRDLGCEVNYCGLVKKSYPMEWEGSSDCIDEIKQFNDCMTRERRRYAWLDEKPPMFDYIQNRLAEKRKEKKFAIIFKPDELEAIEKLREEDRLQMEKEKMKNQPLIS
ncbi:UNKNOWN [Stylonychia lemnae]|uniref:Uncharacterized protein n=1 Tax=Stylonychia lemnae TaxID=5949 RepID=A0A078BBL6_STYLE|nr:UNKNOWN [Stylonychia lemnae]|eukprot:CDW90958.1 UNKNOWN [Stylonychia lemnae]